MAHVTISGSLSPSLSLDTRIYSICTYIYIYIYIYILFCVDPGSGMVSLFAAIRDGTKLQAIWEGMRHYAIFLRA